MYDKYSFTFVNSELKNIKNYLKISNKIKKKNEELINRKIYNKNIFIIIKIYNCKSYKK